MRGPAPETVEENQRVLIDNVLGRYSGNFTGPSRFLGVP